MQQYIENAFIGTVLILTVSLLRRVFRNYLPPGTWIVLWGLCIVRLLSPIIPSSPFSVYNLYHMIAPLNVAESVQEIPVSSQIVITEDFLDSPISSAVFSETEQVVGDITASINTWVKATNILFGIYLFGVLCMLVWFTIIWIREYRLIRNAGIIDRSDDRYALLPRFVSLREGNIEGAPFTFGVIRPNVVIPPNLHGKNLHYVLMHEGIHAKRRDNIWHIIVAIVRVAYWWNPVVWLMARLLRQDVELSCDHAVLTQLGYEMRKDYAKAVISLSTKGKSPAFSNTFGNKNAEERICAIMKFKKNSLIATVLAIVLVFGTGSAFAANAVSANQPAADKNEGGRTLEPLELKMETNRNVDFDETHREPEIVIDDATGMVAADVVYYQSTSNSTQKLEEVDQITEGALILAESEFALNAIPISSTGTKWTQPDGYSANVITITNTQSSIMKVTISYDENSLSFYVPANSVYSYIVKNAWAGYVHTLDFSSDNGTVSGTVSVQVAER